MVKKVSQYSLVTKKAKIKSPYYKTEALMSKEVTFNLSERVQAAKILNSFKGDLTQLALFLGDIKNIAITEAEWTDAGLTKTPMMGEDGKPSGQESWNWNDKPELDKVITLDGETTLYLLNAIKAKEEAKEITMADAALVTLKAKLQ